MSRGEGTESNPYSTVLYLLQLRYHLLITSSLSLLMASDSSSKWMMENGDIPHVLAVDDNIIDRTLVEKHLKNSSCKVTTAENRLKALEYIGYMNTSRENKRIIPANLEKKEEKKTTGNMNIIVQN
ncbi:response regulator, putative [Medicago truncatula]|uniref:Response regulator, putative n=1 Tax=Medicago truncatula TaxID=3880 RepID=G7IQH6_MEDTR|nr:response regulator, putative [Medicago truncatula]